MKQEAVKMYKFVLVFFSFIVLFTYLLISQLERREEMCLS